MHQQCLNLFSSTKIYFYILQQELMQRSDSFSNIFQGDFVVKNVQIGALKNQLIYI